MFKNNLQIVRFHSLLNIPALWQVSENDLALLKFSSGCHPMGHRKTACTRRPFEDRFPTVSISFHTILNYTKMHQIMAVCISFDHFLLGFSCSLQY